MKNSKQSNPSQEEQPHNRPQQGQQKTEPPKEGDIRKVEGSTQDNDSDLKDKGSLKSEDSREEENTTSGTRDDEAKNKRAR